VLDLLGELLESLRGQIPIGFNANTHVGR
jgi:hypothetical protein